MTRKWPDNFERVSLHIDEIKHQDPSTADHPEYLAEHAAEYEQYGGAKGYIEHLTRDIQQYGLDTYPEVEHDGRVRDGHHRVEAARRAGLTHITVLRYHK